MQELRQAVQATLEQAVLLELLPGSELEVFVQVLQADGGERTACINAAVLAVANAGNKCLVMTLLARSLACSLHAITQV